MAYIPSSSSVVAFQSDPNKLVATVSVVGTLPVVLNNSSIISVSQGSVATVIVGGSIAATFTPPANQSVSGTVGASIIGLPPVNVTNTVTVVSSIAGGIFPVSGSVAATIVGTPNVNAAGSVVAFQGGAPWANTNVGSVITVGQGSIATVIIGGSIAATFTPPANQSVSGTVQTDVRGSIAAVIIGGSIATATTNSSVMLLNGANTIGSVTALQGTNPWTVVSSIAGGIFPISGSVAATIVGTPNVNTAGSVVAFQGGAPWANTIVGSVISLSQGSIAAVIIGGSIATATTNSSVMLLAGGNMIGSVAAYQGAIPWIIGSVYGNISGSVAATITNTNINVSGSVVGFQGGTQITSLVSTIPSSVQVGASVMGIAPVTLTANTVPASVFGLNGVTANTVGSLMATTGYPMMLVQITSNPSINGAINFEGTADSSAWVPINGVNISNYTVSSMATIDGDWSFNTTGLQGIRTRLSNWTAGSIFTRGFATPNGESRLNVGAGNQSVSGTVTASIVGTVPATQSGTWSTSVMTNVITSIATAGQVMGSVAALQGTNPWVVNFANSSIIAINAGSVVAIPTGSTIAVLQGSSILAVPVGSVIVMQQAPSIVGTYAEDAAHTTGDKGIAVWTVRNDTLSSVTSADGDYSPYTVGPVGETVMANSPITKWVSGTASMLGGTPVNGGSVTVIAAQGSSIFTYISGIQIANASANNVFLRFDGATSSTIGFTIAPANGGSNIVFPNPIKTNANGGFTASISGVASVYLSAQGFISKT